MVHNALIPGRAVGVIFQLTQAPSETESTLGLMVSIFLGKVLVGHAVGNETDTVLPRSEARAQQNVAMLPWDQLASTERLKVLHQEGKTPDCGCRPCVAALTQHRISPHLGSGARCWTTVLTDSFMNQLPSMSTGSRGQSSKRCPPVPFSSRRCKLRVNGTLFLFCFSCL